MRLLALAIGLVALRCRVLAWGGFGHITVAYLASALVSPATEAYFQRLLRNDTEHYLAGVATWADSVRYTRWGRFSEPFHYIDAKDQPPHTCGVVYARDCKPAGCIVSALRNYTTQLLDPARENAVEMVDGVPERQRALVAKFVVHFVGDIHQPLHVEDVAKGGNGIHVTFQGVQLNLHHVWDSSFAEHIVGGVSKKPFAEAQRWASRLATELRSGKFASERDGWLDGCDLEDLESTALAWAREGNAYVCSAVLPDGPEAIAGQELGPGTDYYANAAQVVEEQIAKAGLRLGAWLDLIASTCLSVEGQPVSDL